VVQQELMAEMCILVDENDNVIGAESKKNSAFVFGLSSSSGLAHQPACVQRI
jgi:hypothetical protein